MKFISLFSGIGGFDKALEQLGHECVYANDIDKYCKITYDKNFRRGSDVSKIGVGEKTSQGEHEKGQGLHTIPGEATLHSGGRPDEHVDRSTDKGQFNSYNYQQYGLDNRSITNVSIEEIPDHELLVGGFPCQSFSIAGKRKGFSDTRGTLFFEIARILREKKPRLCLLENVKGLLSHDDGNTFKTIIATLDELRYDLQWQVLNSKNYGVPQNRERVFIIGHLRGTPRPEVFPITGTNGEADEKNKSTALDANYWKGIDNHGQRTAIVSMPHGFNKGGFKELPSIRACANFAGNELLAVGTLRTHKDGEGFREMKSGLAPTIPARAREDGSGQPIIIEKPRIIDTRQMTREKEPRIYEDNAPALNASMYKEPYQVTDGWRIRRLTPKECERLQGFPDEWTQGVSDTQRYKQLGNAVTVNVIYEIAKRL